MTRRATPLVSLLAVLASCGGSSPTAPKVAEVDVTPSSGAIAVGATLQLSARALDASGTTVGGGTISWSSTDPSVATVNSSGVVTGVTPGTTTVRATEEGVSGSAAVTVTPIPVATVDVTPSTVAIFTGQTAQLTATAKAANGDELPGRQATWSSNDATVATVSSSGLVTGVAPGTATVTATIEGKSATAAVTVTAKTATSLEIVPGSVALWRYEALQFTVVAKADDGTVLTAPGVTWTSSDATVATTVVDTLGLVIGVNPGTATVTATGGGFSATATVTVKSYAMGGRRQTIAAGATHTCGITSGGKIYCWGDGSRGALAQGDTSDHTTPVETPSLSNSAGAIAAGGHFTCVFPGTNGNFADSYCWGAGSEGQLGNGASVDTSTPTAVTGATIWNMFEALSAGDSHACGLTMFGKVSCWGDGGFGRLGGGSLSSVNTPTPVSGDLTVGFLGAGTDHTCAVATDGTAWCWGHNDHGQLGDGSTTDASTPVAVQGGHAFVTVASGANHTCGIDDTGAAWCWGAGTGLGDGVGTDSSTPVAVTGGLSFLSLSAGNGDACGVTSDYHLYCWGGNASGQLGDGTTTPRSAPTLVPGGLAWSVVSAGDAHTCAVTTSGVAYCWGSGANGRLGTGSTTDRSTPTAVAGGLKFLTAEPPKAPGRGG